MRSAGASLHTEIDMKHLFFCALLIVTQSVSAEVRLPKIIGSHMVLQQRSSVRLWGWAGQGEEVTVVTDWLDTRLTTVADEHGRWEIDVRTGPAGKPHTMTIQGENSIVLEDVLFGEVWLASGQSNMEMPLITVSNAYTGIQNAEQEVAAADFPEIRLFQAGNFSSDKPLDDVQPGISMYGIPPAKCQWQECSPESIPTFSSTAYFFARELHQRLDVPIGIIDSSWGGTSAETWTPRAGLEQLEYTAELKQASSQPQKSDQKVPTRLYNGMIHPLRHTRIRGVIWYQGEGNARRADQYHELFTTMITHWRKAFGNEFPFYYVQIAPFNYGNVNSAYLREAQFQSLSLARTGMVVTLDIGNLKDIHPKNKQEVGRRLALWALKHDYQQDVVASGPLYQSHQVDGNRIEIEFSHAAEGLITRDAKRPSHFEVAGEDRKFHSAETVIRGSKVVVSSPQVKSPVAVRFAFTNDAMPNLINSVGLPASSFRTDSW